MSSVLDRRIEQARRTTRLSIEHDGDYIALMRPAGFVSDGAGSMVRDDTEPTELDPIKRLLIGLTMVGRGVNQEPERFIITEPGERVRVVYVLIGTYDDDIQKGDYWMDGDDKLEVVFVHPDKSFQTKAEIIRIGQ